MNLEPIAEPSATEMRIQVTNMTNIEKVLLREYGDAVDITDEWRAMTPAERQKVVANGLHVETDRSGRRVLGTLSQWRRTQNLRDIVTGKRKEEKVAGSGVREEEKNGGTINIKSEERR